VTKLTAIKSKRMTRPQGLYWMCTRSGIDMQVRAEQIIAAEPVINGEKVCVLYLGAYDKEHQIIVAENIGHLYDRPVFTNGQTGR